MYKQMFIARNLLVDLATLCGFSGGSIFAVRMSEILNSH